MSLPKLLLFVSLFVVCSPLSPWNYTCYLYLFSTSLLSSVTLFKSRGHHHWLQDIFPPRVFFPAFKLKNCRVYAEWINSNKRVFWETSWGLQLRGILMSWPALSQGRDSAKSRLSWLSALGTLSNEVMLSNSHSLSTGKWCHFPSHKSSPKVHLLGSPDAIPTHLKFITNLTNYKVGIWRHPFKKGYNTKGIFCMHICF